MLPYWNYAVIVIDPENGLDIHEFNDKILSKEIVCSLLGENCKQYQTLNPEMIFDASDAAKAYYKTHHQFLIMFVDEESFFNNQKINKTVSYLSGAYKESKAVLGAVVFLAMEEDKASTDWNIVAMNNDRDFDEIFGMIKVIEEDW